MRGKPAKRKGKRKNPLIRQKSDSVSLTENDSGMNKGIFVIPILCLSEACPPAGAVRRRYEYRRCACAAQAAGKQAEKENTVWCMCVLSGHADPYTAKNHLSYQCAFYFLKNAEYPVRI